MNTFSYETIDRDANVFRVLQVEGIDELGRVTCRMRNALVAETKYYALSYTWGSSGKESTAVVNGEQTCVTKNLEDFLKKACTLFEGFWIWIDALCINQDDIPERNHQVQQMGSIYTKARKVIVWLGVIPALEDLFWQLNRERCAIAHYSVDQVIGIIDDLMKLDKIAYRRRIWVVQELILARSIQLVLGDEVISWEEFWYGIKFLEEHANTFYSTKPAKRLKGMSMLVHKTQKDSYSQMTERTTFPLDLFATYATFECSNLSDRVYGLMSLFDHRGFPVYYSDHPRKLALRLWFHLRYQHSEFVSLQSICQSLNQSRTVEYAASNDCLRDFGVLLRDPMYDSMRRIPPWKAWSMHGRLEACPVASLGKKDRSITDVARTTFVKRLGECFSGKRYLTTAKISQARYPPDDKQFGDEVQFHDEGASKYTVKLTTTMHLYEPESWADTLIDYTCKQYSVTEIILIGTFNLS